MAQNIEWGDVMSGRTEIRQRGFQHIKRAPESETSYGRNSARSSLALRQKRIILVAWDDAVGFLKPSRPRLSAEKDGFDHGCYFSWTQVRLWSDPSTYAAVSCRHPVLELAFGADRF